MTGQTSLLQDFLHWTRHRRAAWTIPLVTALVFLIGLLFLTRTPATGPPVFPVL
jgi:hypothetical protein